jgi:hypothetical protein
MRAAHQRTTRPGGSVRRAYRPGADLLPGQFLFTAAVAVRYDYGTPAEPDPTVTLHDIDTLYPDHAVFTVVAFAAALGLLLVLINRLRRLAEHRLALYAANFLTVIAAALATMVSASGMWKFFTDILGPSPLRIAFFAYIEVALFASALLARARLLREPEKGTTGADGIAVWVLAALTASLSALDANSFREVCLRLAAPLVAAWMWERALAAERSARLGSTISRIHWSITIERILVWLRLAEAHGRDVSEVDRARRRAQLGRARLRLHLVQNRNAATWRIHRAHHRVVRQAMHAAEHIGLADVPHAANEREAVQMYMATLYGVIEATTPEAVARFNAWHPDNTATTSARSSGTSKSIGTPEHIEPDPATPADAAPPTTIEADSAPSPTIARSADRATGDPANQIASAETDAWEDVTEGGSGRRHAVHDPPNAERHEEESLWPSTANGTQQETSDLDKPSSDDVADRSAVAAMRRFWDNEIAQRRMPTGAELSRAAGVPPTTGLGRRKRREWEADLPKHIKTTVTAGR